MFKPEVDRHNWSWSEWDSPSRELEDVSHETDDWPVRDPLAALPPKLREQIRAILAMKPRSPTNLINITETGTYNKSSNSVLEDACLKLADLPSPVFPSGEPTRPESPESSSWIDVDARPWPDHLQKMWIDSEKTRAYEKKGQQAEDCAEESPADPSPPSPAASSLTASSVLVVNAPMPDPFMPALSADGAASDRPHSSTSTSRWVDLGGLRRWNRATLAPTVTLRNSNRYFGC
ncbi:hypothetical protein GGS23DRAFT_599234 [Durotheca rogersii]|uniref:uncharacterized protein n=1 Tax=Durotheca rogersii TaxID=419775 RepID=UPI00221E9A59|nr:uncharacterized protein GGS23DRAFT_599234 [Durotheca rogersii]KAI5860716.1 hypothetical protein GGS23DRAFT_599234 [Durotheca rogersii]